MCENDDELRVFRATPGPFITNALGVLISVLALLLLSITLFVIAFSSSLNKAPVLIVVSAMWVFVLAFGIVTACLYIHNQFGVAIDDEGVEITSRTSKVKVKWEEIAELHRDKSFFGPFTPSKGGDDQSKQTRKKIWKEQTTGVRLSLISHKGDVLARLHSSNYEDFQTIANLIETRVTQLRARPARNMETEKARALRKFRRRATIYIVFDLVVLFICLGYNELYKENVAKNAYLTEHGTMVQAVVLDTESLGEEAILVKYEFEDSAGQSHSSVRRLKADAWEQREAGSTTIEVVFDPQNPKRNNPKDMPLDSVLLFKPMRVIFVYVMPAVFLPSLILCAYQLFTSNYHFETDRFTIVKLGKSK